MSYTKNYYTILNLPSPSLLGGTATTTTATSPSKLKAAYRAALLAAHPDKTAAVAAATAAGGSKEGVGGGVHTHTHTVDDVKEAYGVLSSTIRRAEYDRWLVLQPGVLSPSAAGGATAANPNSMSEEFVLGLEVLDLSDFAEAEGRWTRGCRCGDEEGFGIGEEELEGAAGRGEGEVLVGCRGCSLWVRVAFEVEEDEEDG